MNRRKRRNLTQERLAEMVGIGQQSLSRMEQGHIAPRFERLQGFAAALGCTVADLFKQEDDESLQASIDDIIRPLSAASQQTLINILSEMSRAMLKLERNQN
jgi:transcriptional regulator with XRE-family HTH domain